MHAATGARFVGLVDLASAAMGGEALHATDDFFAGKERLIAPEPATFDPDAYTDRGKEMDGWESRRKRVAGHDWCIVRLGVPGRVRAVDIDTAYFLGNHPPFAALEGCFADPDASVEELLEAAWRPVVPCGPLRPGSQNLFTSVDGEPVSHVRLHIYPDGGVARLRVWGEVLPEPQDDGVPDLLARRHVGAEEQELVGLRRGGRALACSDAFFGPMDNLLLPTRAPNMGGGWETRRRRGPGNDWIVLQLGQESRVRLVEVDTSFFKGNYPARCALWGIRAPEATPWELVQPGAAWVRLLPEVPLGPDERFFFRDPVVDAGPVTHVRLETFPDGGVSRLRLYGEPVR